MGNEWKAVSEMEAQLGNGEGDAGYFCVAETWKHLADAVAELRHEHV